MCVAEISLKGPVDTMRTLHLARTLRLTAARLKDAENYRWTHQGRCNCGFLAQTITGHTGAEIHEMALRSEGEWKDHAAAYCENSGYPIDDVIREMLEFGLTVDDLADLEYLRASEVLRWLPSHQKHPDYRVKEDVIAYFETWAAIIEAQHEISSNPSASVFVNGRRYEAPKIERIAMALDENPAAGKKAA